MFSPEPMLKLSVLVLEHDARSVLKALGRRGGIQLTRTSPEAGAAALGPRDRCAERERCDRLVARSGEIRRQLKMPAAPTRVSTALTFEEAEQLLSEWEHRVGAVAGEWETCRKREIDLEGMRARVALFEGVDLPLDDPNQFSFLHLAAGTLPVGGWARLRLPESALVVPLPARRDRQPVVALAARADAIELGQSLQRAGFQADILPVQPQASVDVWLQDTGQALEAVNTDLEQAAADVRQAAAELAEPLANLEAWAARERRLVEAEQLLGYTDASTLISGWIPAADRAVVETTLKACTCGRCVLETAPAEDLPGSEPPVLMRNVWWLRPFQALVDAYGLPRYGEVSPTLFVALSYVVMFGMMFGDVGHGGLLLLAGVALRHFGGGVRTRDAGVLLAAAGLSSAAFGLAYGSCFGLPQFRPRALWRDPLEGDPVVLMLLALGLGVVLMSLGVVLNVFNQLRRGHGLGGLLGRCGVMGLVFYWGALALLAVGTSAQSTSRWPWAAGFLLGLPVMGWILKEPLEAFRARSSGQPDPAGGVGLALVESMVGAFEGVLLYLANTISFVRLAAYAMSHAAILMATFALADQLRQVTGAGDVLAWIAIVSGNTVAFVLEGVVAAVQALRLEYYEFFGKFHTGEGQAFVPFVLEAIDRR